MLYEIIKKYPDNDVVKALVKEHFKDSYFTLAFYPSKNQNDNPNDDENKATNVQKKSLVNKFKDLFKWKKIFRTLCVSRQKCIYWLIDYLIK